MANKDYHLDSIYSRPLIHFTTSTWINDPCAPGYDPSTGDYHLFYQCNPFGCEWGNMSWGHATSRDLLNWNLTSNQPALKPDQEYDREGVFTGCFAPLAAIGSQQPTIVYSSVRKLPFHWGSPPYPRNAAGLALATSNDGCITWEKSPCNPVLVGEPDGVKVTGFRDPYMARWPAADRLLNHAEEKFYGLVSGGVEGSGPTIFLYEIQINDLTKWKYLGLLTNLEPRFQPSKKWSGNYGVNWECANFITFQTESVSRHFLIMGAEGDIERDHVKSYKLPASLPARTIRTQVWMSGDLVKKDGSIKFQYTHGGYLDHGSYYAANSFLDPDFGRQILHGWIPEEDIPLDHARRKGWNGCLAIPREVFPLTITSVVKALRSPLSEISSVNIETKSDGSTSVFTLGVKPIAEVDRWRGNCCQFRQCSSPFSLPDSALEQSHLLFATSSPTWELEAVISIDPTCETVGFHIRHNHDLSTRTTITFSALDETIIVDRAASTISSKINKCVESGPFTLFTTRQPGAAGGDGAEQNQERLHFRVFSDADVLEVFANERFALATMVYSSNYDVSHGGITAFATGGHNSAVFESVKIWDGLNGMKSVVVDRSAI